MDLSQYTATTPYKRLGGIAGGVSSDTPAFENNYFVETGNVSACFKYQNAGTEKTLDSMKTEDFFNEITAAGGNYRFNSNGTPILPAPKYAVSFVVTPAELANVVIKVNGQEVANPVDLEAGTYTVEVSADNCEVFNSNITITADTATHTQTIAMTYLPVDYYEPTYPVTTPDKTENGAVTVSPKNADKGDSVTVTVKPDAGYVLDNLTVTLKNGNELTLVDKGNGEYTFIMPDGNVDVKATFVKEAETSPFRDVSTNAYYYEAVKWAQEKGITDGIGNDLFGSDLPCTRSQIVTFLWRAAGSPEPKGNSASMTDVVPGSYYEKAVAWAIENGVTNGTGDGKFSPDATCTRAQAVTFLARALNAKATGKAEFSDVPADSYFADAVAWALSNGVTTGIGGGLFAPDSDCTRAQIVTFLFRAYNK